MFKGLQCILLISSMLSVSLFGGKNIGLTKEIDNQRECVVCSVNSVATEDSEEYVLGYTDGFWVEEDETVYLLNSYGSAVLEVKKKMQREIPLSASALLPHWLIPLQVTLRPSQYSAKNGSIRPGLTIYSLNISSTIASVVSNVERL